MFLHQDKLLQRETNEWRLSERLKCALLQILGISLLFLANSWQFLEVVFFSAVLDRNSLGGGINVVRGGRRVVMIQKQKVEKLAVLLLMRLNRKVMILYFKFIDFSTRFGVDRRLFKQKRPLVPSSLITQ